MLGDSILQFWAIPLVGSILMLLASLLLAPRIFRTITGLMGRTGDPGDTMRVSSTSVTGALMFDGRGMGWIQDEVSGESISWHESTPDDGMELAYEHGIYEGRIFFNKDGSPRLDSESTDV
jgi:hypothetical protein